MSDSTGGSASSGDPFLDRAAEVAAKLKPGTYDSVQALALLSIAKNLSRIAAQLEQR